MVYDTKWKQNAGGRLYSDKAVMELLTQGKRREDICRELGMPMGTLNSCCTRIYKREGCNSLAEFIVKQNTEKDV